MALYRFKYEKILLEIERGFLCKKLFCHVLKITEDELYDFLYNKHDIDLKLVQIIIEETTYTLDELFEKV